MYTTLELRREKDQIRSPTWLNALICNDMLEEPNKELWYLDTTSTEFPNEIIF